jgi:hypothetical protein
MKRFLRVVGLAWIALLATVTAISAQATTEGPAPPVRLPGIVYPGSARATVADPNLKPKGQRARTSVMGHPRRRSHRAR